MSFALRVVHLIIVYALLGVPPLEDKEKKLKTILLSCEVRQFVLNHFQRWVKVRINDKAPNFKFSKGELERKTK